MTRDELNAIRLRDGVDSKDPGYGNPFQTEDDRRALLAYVDQLLGGVAAADAWLAKDDEVEDDPSTVGAREAYRAARKSLEGT